MLLLAALLCGCGTDENSGEDVRAHYENVSGFSAHVKILSETDDFTMAFELDYAYNKEEKHMRFRRIFAGWSERNDRK